MGHGCKVLNTPIHGSRCLGISGSGGSMDDPSCTHPVYRICATRIQRISHGCEPCATCVLLYRYLLTRTPQGPQEHHSYRDSRPRIHGSQGLGPEALILWMSHLCAHWHSVALPSPVGSWESVCVSGRHSLALWVLGVSSSCRRRYLSWAVADSHPDP